MGIRGPLNDAELHVLLPANPNVAATDLHALEVKQRGFTDPGKAFDIEQRSLLYFDELIPTYIILQTTLLDEPRLKSLLSRLSLHLDARAYGGTPAVSDSAVSHAERSPSQSEDLVWSGEVEADEEPVISIQACDGDDTDRVVLVMWPMLVRLNRPRVRLQSPMIEFQVSATLHHDQATSIQSRDSYLPSGVASTMNLLEALSDDPSLQGSAPRLAASRLSRVQSFNRENDQLDARTYKSRASIFRAVPPLSSRIHYTKSKNNGRNISLIASIDIETAPFSSDDIEITSVQMSLIEGTTEDLLASRIPNPLACRPKDVAVFLFRLQLDSTFLQGLSPTSAQTVEIKIDATVLGPRECRPRIEMRWKTGVDFSAALNPIYGPPGQPMQRNRRPSSLTMRTISGAGHSGISISGQTAAHDIPDSSIEGLHGRQRALSVSDLGVTITLTAPRSVRLGEPFTWSILVVNSSRRLRRLNILAVSRPMRHLEQGHWSTSSESTIIDSSSDRGAHAGANVSDVALRGAEQYAHSDFDGPCQVLCLDTDMKLQSLNPGASIDAKLRFIPLVLGILKIAAVKVTDAVSGESVDVKDLPDIVCEHGSDEVFSS